MASFAGWPPEALTFYEGLAADNSKAYWQASRQTYEEAVRAPMLAFADLVRDEFGPLHLFRPHRDVRFSSDKSPYKTHCGALTEGDGGELYYVQLGADGLMAASGYYEMAADQLERFRAAVDDDELGEELVAVCEALVRAGYELGARTELKTAPRGVRRDHPRIAILRRKGLIASRRFPPAAWMSTRRAGQRVVDTWRGAAPLNAWLNRHVGPSTAPPDELWSR